MKFLINLCNIILTIIAIVALSFAFSKKANSAEISFISLDEVDLVYRNYTLDPNNRPLLIYPQSAKEGINVNINMDILKYGYWDNQIESLTTDSKYEGIGLQFSLGVRVTDWLDLGIWHHSQHTLDNADPYVQPFPEETAIEVKIILYQARPGRPSIFGGLLK